MKSTGRHLIKKCQFVCKLSIKKQKNWTWGVIVISQNQLLQIFLIILYRNVKIHDTNSYAKSQVKNITVQEY